MKERLSELKGIEELEITGCVFGYNGACECCCVCEEERVSERECVRRSEIQIESKRERVSESLSVRERE